MPIFPPDRRPTVEIRTLGTVSTAAVTTATQTLSETFGIDAEHREGPQPGEIVEPESTAFGEGYAGEPLLDAMANRSDADIAIGLTNAQISHEERPFVNGLALVGGSAAIITTDRFSGPREQFVMRVQKQVRKQMGRLLGLDATHEDCVLEPALTVSDLDETAPTFCDTCRAQLTDPETAPRPPLWAVGTGRRPDETDESPGLSLRTLPLLPIGIVAMALAPIARVIERLSAWEQSRPPQTRRLIHGSYRVIRFWLIVFLFVAFSIGSVLASVSLYERFVTPDPGTAILWLLFFVSIGVGYYAQLFVRAIAVGLYEGLRDGPDQ